MDIRRAPPFSSLARTKTKLVKPEPVLDIPPGLQTQYIRKWDSIPDEYITQHFVLEEYRKEKRRVLEAVPLFKTLAEQLIGRPILSSAMQRDAFEDEEDDEIDFSIRGQAISMNQLKTVLTNFLNSDATLALFQTAEVHYYGYDPREDDAHTYNVTGRGEISPCEVFLCKEDVTYETNRVIIDRLKREVYNKIVRWRNAKEKY